MPVPLAAAAALIPSPPCRITFNSGCFHSRLVVSGKNDGRRSYQRGEVVKKIGVLFGMENTFPPALVDKINSMQVPDVQAEAVQLGGVKMAVPSGYAVIIDRISHDIPFYRAY